MTISSSRAAFLWFAVLYAKNVCAEFLVFDALKRFVVDENHYFKRSCIDGPGSGVSAVRDKIFSGDDAVCVPRRFAFLPGYCALHRCEFHLFEFPVFVCLRVGIKESERHVHKTHCGKIGGWDFFCDSKIFQMFENVVTLCEHHQVTLGNFYVFFGLCRRDRSGHQQNEKESHDLNFPEDTVIGLKLLLIVCQIKNRICAESSYTGEIKRTSPKASGRWLIESCRIYPGISKSKAKS